VAVVATLLAARFLAVRRSWVAVAAAGALGWVGANLLQVVLADGDWDAARLSIRTVSFAVLFTLLAAVGLDLVARPGSLARGDRAGLLVLPRPFRDIRRRLEPYARYREIAGIARRNGLSLASTRRRHRLVERSFSVGLRKTLEESGIVFVKLGQMASTRDDLLPKELTTELARLHSRVEPAPREVMQPQLEGELGEPVDALFAEFDWTPIGSASVAQAYAATLLTGEPVIVKVQRPDMDELVARDSTALLHLARVLEQRTPLGRELHARELTEEFVRSLRDELDFLAEAANAIDIATATADTAGVRIPKVHRPLVTRRVLVEERFHGASVGDRERMAALGIEGTVLADRLVQAMVDQLVYGHFHADPHPGNVLLLDDGSLGLIDFGMTGNLDATQRAALLQMTICAANGDAVGLREGVEQVAEIGPDVAGVALDRALAHFLAQHLRPGHKLGADAMNELVPLLSQFDIRLPSDLTMCLRALVLLDGTVRAIDPGYSLVEGLRRLIGDGGVRAAATGPMKDQLTAELVRQLPKLKQLPAHLERITALTARGDLRVRVGLFSSAEDARVVTLLVNRVLLVVTGGLLLVASALLLAATAPSTAEGTPVLEVFGYVGLAIGTVLVLRVVAAVVRDGYE
jgi:ubiquinone biosynthesis protein